MDKIPQRNKLALAYRLVLDKLEKYLIYPSKDPSHYQIVGLLLSICYVLTHHLKIQIILIVTILVLDWMDGSVARKYKLAGKRGWLIDVFIDRISEAFIFIAHISTNLGITFFILYLFNISLSFYSIKSGNHTILPLRFVWLVILLTHL